MYTKIHTEKHARRQKCNCIGAFSGGESLFLGWHGRKGIELLETCKIVQIHIADLYNFTSKQCQYKAML